MEANDAIVIENEEEARKGVIVAYQEIMNKLKVMKDENANFTQETQESCINEERKTDPKKNKLSRADIRKIDADKNQNLNETVENDNVVVNIGRSENENNTFQEDVIELASRETVDELSRNITDLRVFLSKSLDDIKNKLTTEYEKFNTLRQAIAYSKAELANLYDIKVNVNTLSLLIMAQKEKEASFEKEISERKQAFENEKVQMEKELFREQNDYMQKRDAMRKQEQEHYEMEKRALYHELLDKRRELEESFGAREASLAARETEHQQLKDREARIVAREQEFIQLKERETKFPDELRAVAAKAEATIFDQLTRKYEYDIKLAQIERDSERKLDQQKINALEQQIEQYKSLKQLFS